MGTVRMHPFPSVSAHTRARTHAHAQACKQAQLPLPLPLPLSLSYELVSVHSCRHGMAACERLRGDDAGHALRR